ncbi:hypothetical protein C5167_044706 [Papaver somniferum]|uniref:uncharacterized protein LOC113335762 n=1 Tax=Papaver somniferum TaxID=3469 RepID=UPI000E6FD615|nr:uncharacterized protein LOC113335762 [Papaver somniferum]RZC90076.1 hypothetical protein C5167_044706 [Papaver somniferum]
MYARGYGNDYRPHPEMMYAPRNPAYGQVDRFGQVVEEMKEIKTLLKTVVESQHQMSETLRRSISTGDGHYYRHGKGEHRAVRDSTSSGYPNHHHQQQQQQQHASIPLPTKDVVGNISTATYKSAAKIKKPSLSSVKYEEITDVVPTDGNGKDQHQVQHRQRQARLNNSTGQPATKQKIVSQKSVEAINKNHVLDGYEPLYDAAVKGDWEKANEFFQKNPNAKTEFISVDSETALHVAVINDRLKFVEKIVELMPSEALAYATKRRGNTALHYAAVHGCSKVAAVLVKKNQHLPQIRDQKRRVPLEVALQSVVAGQKETVEYLYSVTKDVGHPSPFAPREGAKLLCKAIDASFYDMALSIIKRFPNLATEVSSLHDVCGLEMMVQRPFAFLSGAKLTWWQQYIYPLIQVDMRPTHNYGARNTFKCLEGTEREEENLLESSEVIEVLFEDNCLVSSEVSSTGDRKGRKNMLISACLVPYIRRVYHIKHLYNQKLMHKQAVALVNEMLGQLDGTMDRTQIVDYFNRNPNIIKTAIRHGNVEFVAQCLEKFDYLVWYSFAGETLIQMAIAERNKMTLNLIFKASGKNKTAVVSRKDKDNNTILHQAAKLASPVQLNLVSGLALQMQRELQWFKGVESIIPVEDKFKRNKDGNTAQYIFAEQHKTLLDKAEEWMKDTSGSCMVVAALIATVAFAAVFTVPGGNISDTNSSKNGVPVFLGKTPFTIFAIADALALFSSVTSVLMFLAVYTSRYAEEDFLRSLPQKMIIGLATLFISMATILVAFGASLFLVLGDKFTWAPIPIAVFGCIPVTLFVKLQLPLFVEMVHSTYWGSLFRKYKHIQAVIMNNNNYKED